MTSETEGSRPFNWSRETSEVPACSFQLTEEVEVEPAGGTEDVGQVGLTEVDGGTCLLPPFLADNSRLTKTRKGEVK